MLVNVYHEKYRHQRSDARRAIQSAQAHRLDIAHQPRVVDSLHGMKLRWYPFLLPRLHAGTLSAHRSFALRDLAFLATSSSVGGITCLVSTFKVPSRSPF